MHLSFSLIYKKDEPGLQKGCSEDVGHVPEQVGTLPIHRLDNQWETLPLPPCIRGDIKLPPPLPYYSDLKPRYLFISCSLSIRSMQATPQYMPFILRNSDIAYSKSFGSWPYLNKRIFKGERMLRKLAHCAKKPTLLWILHVGQAEEKWGHFGAYQHPSQ